MAKCDYRKCEKEATVSGYVFARDGESLAPVKVDACDTHKKKDGFFEESGGSETSDPVSQEKG
ncbi:hypothetical protein ABEX47_17275 [Paenibacillus ehimensis]|uniref:hypothetical protein n=1 Tax=Paenibacillus ehimensis TaxID=79264 RepID=UPI000FD82F48|nr:hypothetical protein [Paenibacillus ehimensis]